MSHKITHREHGHGPLLLLLHGYGGSVMHWDPVVDRLKDRYRVVVPNLTHLYLSNNKLLFPVIVELLSEYLKIQYPGEKFSVAGLSFGGAVAWGLALRHPEQIERLMLINPLSPHPVEKLRLPEVRYFFVLGMQQKAVLRLFATPIGKAFLAKAAEIFRPDRASASHSLSRLTGTKLAFIADIVAHFSWLLRSEDWTHWEKSLLLLRVPSFVLWAKDDQLFSTESYRSFAATLGAVRSEEMEEGGHILSRSRPEELARFLEECMSVAPETRKSA